MNGGVVQKAAEFAVPFIAKLVEKVDGVVAEPVVDILALIDNMAVKIDETFETGVGAGVLAAPGGQDSLIAKLGADETVIGDVGVLEVDDDLTGVGGVEIAEVEALTEIGVAARAFGQVEDGEVAEA